VNEIAEVPVGGHFHKHSYRGVTVNRFVPVPNAKLFVS
jgi:hypothetical protein